MDLQIHDIDLACWLLGEPSSMTMTQRQSPSRAESGFYHTVSCLKFGPNAAAMLEAGHLMPEGYPFTNGFRLLFDRGVLEWTRAARQHALILYGENETTDLTGWYNDQYARRDPYGDEIAHFVHCLETHEEFAVTAHDARRAVEIALKLSREQQAKEAASAAKPLYR